MGLAGFQRSYLKGLAHRLRPIVMVGEAGATPEVHQAVAQALLEHELVKVRMQEPDDKKAMAAALAEGAGAELVGLVGHTVILYKRHPKKPRLHVPERGPAP